MSIWCTNFCRNKKIKNSKYLNSITDTSEIVCNKIINVIDSVPTNVTSNAPKNVTSTISYRILMIKK